MTINLKVIVDVLKWGLGCALMDLAAITFSESHFGLSTVVSQDVRHFRKFRANNSRIFVGITGV
jgi:hypothetical protein